MNAMLQIVSPVVDEWITAEEAMARTGWSNRHLRRQVSVGVVITRESGERAPNGRELLEYLAQSLPSYAVSPTPSMGAPITTSPLFANVPPIESPRILLPDPEAQKQAEERFQLLQPLFDYASDRHRFKSLHLADGSPILSRRMLEIYLCEKHNISRRTLLRWLRSYRNGGFAALADRTRRDRNVSRWAAQSAQHQQIAELAIYVFLQEHLSKHMAWEVAVAGARQEQIEPPSYETIRQILENVPASVKTLALDGRRKYEEIFAPYVRRGYTDFSAGEILVSDHAIHDVLVQNDLFDAKDRRHMRLRFTGLLDMRSRMFTGYAWSQEGSSRSIVTCLRRSLSRFGPSRELYCDNGKDYQKIGKGARSSSWSVAEIPPEAMGVIARLGMDIRYCIKFHPQSKLIERANNTLHQRFDRRFVTYTGPTPEKRPDRCIAALERHQKLLAAGHPEESDLPLASEFIRAAIAWIEGEYHRRPHTGEGMDGLSPVEAFEQHRWKSQPPAPEPETLATLLAERETRKIRECAIEIAGRRYIAADAVSGIEMHERTGSSIQIAFDPSDMDSVAALDADGHLVAWLQPETLLRQSNDEETSAAIEQSMAERGRYRRSARERLEALSRRVRSTGYISQDEQMRRVGQLPIEIDDLVVHRPQTPAQTKRQAARDIEARTPPTPAEAARIFMQQREALRK